MPYFSTSNTDLYYRTHGRGRTALVMIHGWYQNGAQAWGALIPHLEKDFRLFIPDLPGHGLTELGNPASLCENDIRLIDFIRYVKQKYKPKKIILMGHSYGAFLTQQVIAREPKLVQGAVAMAAIDDYAPYTKRLKGVLSIPKFLTPLYYRVQAMLGAFPYGDLRLMYGRSILKPRRLTYAHLKNRTLSPMASRAQMQAFLGAKVEWPRMKIPTPLLLIYGAADFLTPFTWSEKILPHTAKGKAISIPETGHNVQISGAERVAQATRNFVKSLG